MTALVLVGLVLAIVFVLVVVTLLVVTLLVVGRERASSGPREGVVGRSRLGV